MPTFLVVEGVPIPGPQLKPRNGDTIRELREALLLVVLGTVKGTTGALGVGNTMNEGPGWCGDEFDEAVAAQGPVNAELAVVVADGVMVCFVMAASDCKFRPAKAADGGSRTKRQWKKNNSQHHTCRRGFCNRRRNPTFFLNHISLGSLFYGIDRKESKRMKNKTEGEGSRDLGGNIMRIKKASKTTYRRLGNASSWFQLGNVVSVVHRVP